MCCVYVVCGVFSVLVLFVVGLSLMLCCCVDFVVWVSCACLLFGVVCWLCIVGVVCCLMLCSLMLCVL